MRTEIYGIRKSELKNQKEYTYHEACEILGSMC